jgi:hypothetical protein
MALAHSIDSRGKRLRIKSLSFTDLSHPLDSRGERLRIKRKCTEKH